MRERLAQAVSPRTYAVWLAPLELVELDSGRLVLSAPAAQRDWIANRFSRVLQSCAAAIFGESTVVEVVARDGEREALTARPRPRVGGADHATGQLTPSPLHPRYTFDQFVIGDGNRLAHAAALAVAELPGQAYNPLFIYGPPGVGKTHLLHSIGNYVAANDPSLRVRYTSVETFTNHFITALRSNDVAAFKSAYRHNDVLLIDDIQFLGAKAKTAEELFHTFNALHQAGAQLVLSCDRTPRDITELESRLRDRFEAGLVSDVRPPDLCARIAILRMRVQRDGLDVSDDSVLELIAERIDDNIRALEGALIRVVAFHSLTGRDLDCGLAAEVLDDLYPAERTRSRRSVDSIQAAVCDAYDITREELLAKTRAPRVLWPRQVAMYLSRELTTESFPSIASHFGGRNHTTVMAAHRAAGERIGHDPELGDLVRSIIEGLRS